MAGEVVALAERLPTHVMSDGEGSIAALVEAVNRDPAAERGTNAP